MLRWLNFFGMQKKLHTDRFFGAGAHNFSHKILIESRMSIAKNLPKKSRAAGLDEYPIGVKLFIPLKAGLL
jgi:hypothetical protein